MKLPEEITILFELEDFTVDQFEELKRHCSITNEIVAQRIEQVLKRKFRLVNEGGIKKYKKATIKDIKAGNRAHKYADQVQQIIAALPGLTIKQIGSRLRINSEHLILKLSEKGFKAKDKTILSQPHLLALADYFNSRILKLNKKFKGTAWFFEPAFKEATPSSKYYRLSGSSTFDEMKLIGGFVRIIRKPFKS